MSQHSSLKVSSVGTRHRNVLKRHERIKKLKEMEVWKNRESAFRLPKVKSLKIKVKKAKAEKAEAAAGEAGAAAPAQAPAAAKPAAKPAAKGK